MAVAAPVGGGGVFTVRPEELYAASGRVAGDQSGYDRHAARLVHDLGGYRQLAGKGDGPDAFAAAYAKVAGRFLEVWAASVVSVGGAATGLTVTANNYAAADWHSNPTPQGPPPAHALPRVIEHPPHYGTVADLRYHGTGQDSDNPVVRWIGRFPDWLSGAMRDAVEQGLRLGRTYDITPSAAARKDDVRTVAGHWSAAGRAATTAADGFAAIVESITDDGNSEWQKAMNAFCQTIWGTSAWGRQREGLEWGTDTASADRRPITTVLGTTAAAISTALERLLAAAEHVTDFAEHAALKAAEAMADDFFKNLDNPLDDFLKTLTAESVVGLTAGLIASFRSHLDYDGVNHAVDTFDSTVHDLASSLLDHLPALDEARLSAPTFRTEDARAEAFGVRSLESFRHTHPHTKPGDTDKGVYRVDLAADEGMDNAHTLDKHVGKTDAQLAQRLRDQQGPNARPTAAWPLGKPAINSASSFADVEKAQDLTQYNIDQNSGRITDWLKGPPKPEPGKNEDFSSYAPGNSYSGYSVTKQPNTVNGGFKADGMNARSIPVRGIKTVLRYDPRLDPPFVVLTSMPYAE